MIEDLIKMARENDKIIDFYRIMDNYFLELEKYHPKTYASLMKELHSLGNKINITEQELNEILPHIKHDNIPSLWTVDQTKHVGEEIGIDFDEWKYNIYTFNYVMNMLRSDYYNEFNNMFSTSPLMKQTVIDSPTFYAHLAKAWLNDEDAPADKVIKYIKIVTEESEDK